MVKGMMAVRIRRKKILTPIEMNIDLPDFIYRYYYLKKFTARSYGFGASGKGMLFS
jgi:hypothetical protein